MHRRTALRASAGGAAFSLLASLVALPVVQTRSERQPVSLRTDDSDAMAIDRRSELVSAEEWRASRSRSLATTVAPQSAPVRRQEPRKPERAVSAPTAPRPGSCGGWEGLVAQWGDWSVAEVCVVMRCESGFDPNAKNRSGATGLLQVLDGSTDPQRNLEQAHAKWAKSGWRPWVCRP